jgi:metallo-beta-lactamase family protein
MAEYYDDETLALIRAGVNPIKFPGLFVSITSEDSKLINEDKTPKIIMSASGMCEAGRIRHHLKHNLWRSECTILFVGYQAEGSLGRIIQDGAKSVKLFGEQIAVKAQIESLAGISGHADKNILLGWLGNIKISPKKVFVNHGGDEVTDKFAATVTETLGFPAEAPYNGSQYDLATGKLVVAGNSVRITKKSEVVRKNVIFERLLIAGRRLISVIEKKRGGSNKDLAKFTDQINTLADKWDR